MLLLLLRNSAANAVVWNAATKSPNVTLSNSDLTATGAIDAGAALPTPATKIITTGKFYFETVVTAGSSFSAVSAGISDGASHVDNTIPGSANARAVSYHSNSTVFRNGAGGTFLSAWENAGAYNIGVAVDADADLVWFRLNGVWNGDPAAGTGGLATFMTGGYAALVSPTRIDNNGALKATTASQTYAAPSGFASYGGESPSGTTYSDTIAELLTAIDGATAIMTMAASRAESAVANDARTAAQTHTATRAEPLGASDSLSTVMTLTASISQAMAANDSMSSVATFGVTRSESVAAGDSLVAAHSMSASIAETMAAFDAVTGGLAFSVTLGEIVTAGDGVLVGMTFNPVIAESVVAGDALASIANYGVGISETAAALDGLLAELLTQTPVVPVTGWIKQDSNTSAWLPVGIVAGAYTITPSAGSTWQLKTSSGTIWVVDPTTKRSN